MGTKVFLYRRQKQLLALLEALGGSTSKIDFQKYLFLYNAGFCETPAFEFVPYRFGCFSFQSYADRRKLTEMGILLDNNSWELAAHQNSFLDLLPTDEASCIQSFAAAHRQLAGDDLVRHVYRTHPYYATRSEIASKLMNARDLKRIEHARARDDNRALFTIGYEGGSFENYLNRLLRNNVRLLVDVRKNPLSRKYGFSKRTLSDTVEKLSMTYIHLPELGIVSDKRRALNTHEDYHALFDEYEATVLPDNTAALDYISKLVDEYGRVALTCFEAESCMCHRGRVASALAQRADWKHEIIHI
ncbi:MAG: DUF488 family protein [Alphaproteobacteria bacterium]|nr:DUF488 family protein [Alphaproteobacteria bacterium]